MIIAIFEVLGSPDNTSNCLSALAFVMMTIVNGGAPHNVNGWRKPRSRVAHMFDSIGDNGWRRR
jgi:hypothetical protein